MFIQIDTREGNKIEFDHPYIEGVIDKKLGEGDYQAIYRNQERSLYVFERKAKNDVFSTFGGDITRFRNEIIRSKENNIQLVIITECSFLSILKGYKYSTVKGLTIMRKLWTISIKYGIPLVFCNSREHMARYMAEFFCYCGHKKLYQPPSSVPFPPTPDTPGLGGCNDKIKTEL